MEPSTPANRTIHIKAEPVDEMPDLLSRYSPLIDSQIESTQQTDLRNPQESRQCHLESMRQEDTVPTQETTSWNTVLPTHLPTLLSNVAICFLDRYTRCFDIPRMRSKLVDAYTEDALMSLQVVTNAVLTQTDYVLYSTHDRGVPPRMKSPHFIGAQSIAAQLLMFDKMTHTPSLSGLRSYEFDITHIEELNNILLVYQGNFYSGDEDTGPPHITSRFVRSFILTPNDPGIASWVDWPWIISNDQMTLFPLH
ncbi:hypothetical protein CPB86DRAFT_554293 [Serendipita vermifera]|nr:hypothetical protein CPB86DRAFT_554293 [Serendipita vermifera]